MVLRETFIKNRQIVHHSIVYNPSTIQLNLSKFANRNLNAYNAHEYSQ